MENLIITIIGAAAGIAVLTINVLTALKFPAKEMKRRFITGQCVVGRIAAGIFYSPAWLIKGIKFIVVYIKTVHTTMNGRIGSVTAKV